MPADALGDGAVRVSRDSKGRGGKTVTLVRGLPLAEAELAALAKQLRSACGSGGTVKDGVVEVQGDHRDRVLALLVAQGYKAKACERRHVGKLAAVPVQAPARGTQRHVAGRGAGQHQAGPPFFLQFALHGRARVFTRVDEPQARVVVVDQQQVLPVVARDTSAVRQLGTGVLPSASCGSITPARCRSAAADRSRARAASISRSRGVTA
jgi:translation initiation factor 1